MHIILAIVGILGGVAIWWWRFKMAKEATDEITDVAGRAWGKWKRYKFRQKVEASPVEAVDDPAAAAVIMMLAVAKETGELKPEAETAVKREVTDTMGISNPTELMVFAKWVASHVEDANNVSLRYSKLWNKLLDGSERRDLLDMVERIAVSHGPSQSRRDQIVAKLTERLGLG